MLSFEMVTWVYILLYYIIYLKLQSVNFASLSLSLFENLELQLFLLLSSVREVMHGSSADESNV